MSVKRHEKPCASKYSTPECVYLSDGTKVVLKRDGKRAWIEVVEQAEIHPAATCDHALLYDEGFTHCPNCNEKL